MFGRKDHAEDEATTDMEKNKDSGAEVPGLTPTPRQEAASLPAPATPAQFRPEIPRRVTQIPGAPRAASALDTDDTRKLIVGREIRLSGEITACEKLVVEGRVEANLTDSRIIDIATTGYFKGTAEVEEAIISGEFQGTLTVRGRLFVRATGKVAGELRYGELEIERGGRISGDVDQNGSAAREAGSEEGAVAAEAN